MTEMRILTVRQPWAWAIVHGGKDVENRVRNIAGNYRGPVAIHAAMGGSAVDRSQDWDDYVNGDHPTAGMDVRQISNTRGVILGIVDLVAVHGVDGVGCMAAIPDCSPWAEKTPGVQHLRLANPRALVEPIPYRGALGLRRLDEDTAARVMEAVA